MTQTRIRFAHGCIAAMAAALLALNLAVADDDLENALMTPPPEIPSSSRALGTLNDATAPSAARQPGATISQELNLDSNADDSTATPTSVTDANGVITVENAKVEIPKGEGFEATISANGQGLLVELGLCEVDANGEVVVGEDGSSRRQLLTRGLVVKKGDILGKQQDDELVQERIVAEQELLVARKEAEKTLEVEVAEAACRVAQASYKRADQLNTKLPGSISEEEVQEKYYDWIRAAKSIEKAKYDLEVNQEKVKVASARVNATDVQIRNRKFKCPLDGVIDDLFVNEGEWLREGTEVMHIIRLDKVQVTGALNAAEHAPEEIDQKEVEITVRRPNGANEPQEYKLTGKIVYVRQVVESGHYYFYAEVTNQKTETGYWLLNPGSLVTLRVQP